eukprot:1264709-Heterocapsa_arctica.AAC.1
MKEAGLCKGTTAVCAFTGRSCDLGYSVFTDDIAGAFLVVDVKDAVEKIEYSNVSLTKGLSEQAQPIFMCRRDTHEFVAKEAL